jgi:hypothetical protein
MKRALATIVTLISCMAMSCTAGGSSTTASGESTSAPSSDASLAEPAILGTWRSTYTCEELEEAFKKAGIDDLIPKWLYAFGLGKKGDEPTRSEHECAGSEEFQRTHFFRPNGYLMNYQGTKLVDDCHCYQLVDGDTFVSLGDPGDPDITLQYTVDGGTLTFDVVPPATCTTANCRDAIAFSVYQYALGPWQRVD